MPMTRIQGLLQPVSLVIENHWNYLNVFFLQRSWALAVEETNRYANTVCGTTPKSRPWKDTNIIEMKAFVGMLICFGVLKLPRIEMYWSEK